MKVMEEAVGTAHQERSIKHGARQVKRMVRLAWETCENAVLGPVGVAAVRQVLHSNGTGVLLLPLR